MFSMRLLALTLLIATSSRNALAQDAPIPQPRDYAKAMRTVAAKGNGKPGVVIHVGDSITYANPYGQWPRMGKGKTDDDRETLSWMHAGADDDSDGWWLARVDHADVGRSHTAAGGLRADELLAGGKKNLASLHAMLKTYRPQALVLMIGTNDSAQGRPLTEFSNDFIRALDLILEAGVVPIVSTIPPVHSRLELSHAYNNAIREIARKRSLPLIDFEAEILRRRPDDWNGSLLNLNDAHPTVERNGVSPTSEPTAANLKESGYLLRGWLSVKKIAEVKHAVFDNKPIQTKSPALPKGEVVRLPVTRDTWFSNVGIEADGNNGGSNRLKLKSYQEMSLIDIDPTPLKGRVILAVTLHVRLAAEPILKRVTVSSFSGDWVEGTATSYEPQRGSSTFRHAGHPDVSWTPDGGDLCRVMLGQGGTRWKMADASPPDANRWQTIPVDPAVVAARVAHHSIKAGDVCTGFLLFDDTGSEWTREGEKFTPVHMPNRFIFSRESGPNSAPYLTVVLGPKDDSPPDATDGAGHRSPSISKVFKSSDEIAAPLPGTPPVLANGRGQPLPKLGLAEIAIVDELDKVSTDGTMIPAQAQGYLASNHLWNARAKEIRLHSARNEFVSFQILIKGKTSVRPSMSFDATSSRNIRVEFGRYADVSTKSVPLPDHIPLGGVEDRDVSPSQSLHAEVYVPHDTPSGDHDGTLTLTSEGQTLALKVRLHVWDFTLPDSLSFLPEMNCYGLPANERDYYRLAHKHRTVLNRVPYSQRGEVAEGCAPVWDGRKLDWTAYDRRFGPYLDGSAFADLPRKGMPIECFYLPLNENWPTPIEPNYNGDYWADRAFTPNYRRDFVEASRQFAEHLHGKHWNETLFHGFFNGKNDFKRNGWSRGSSPWLLDEPANFQDFWALRYFATAFHEGVNAAGPGTAKVVFRADISRPQWQRDSLDGLLDYNVVGSAVRSYRRIVMDRKEAEQQIVVEYGSANPIEESNMQAVGWSLDSWAIGTDGVLPWQTIGRAESWEEADTLSLFYPSKNGNEPVPSVRLKAFRRGQQDVEYLTLLSIVTKEPRWAVAERVREALGLVGERGASGTAGAAEDAGLLRYKRLRPQDAWALRFRVGEAVSNLHPAPKRRLVEFRTPPRDPSKLTAREVGK